MTRTLAWLLVACGGGSASERQGSGEVSADPAAVADVVGVEVSGADGSYTFAVSIRSDETGCAQYADWWEVVRADETLAYRRILNHSHPDEQPFTRDGGPVPVTSGEQLVVRAHHNPTGFTGSIFVGSIESGFVKTGPDPGFAQELASAGPFPVDCWF